MLLLYICHNLILSFFALFYAFLYLLLELWEEYIIKYWRMGNRKHLNDNKINLTKKIVNKLKWVKRKETLKKDSTKLLYEKKQNQIRIPSNALE